MKKGNSEPLSPQRAAELALVAAMPDENINLRDIPEVLDWTGAVRGKFHRPPQEQKTLSIDSDVLAWFEAQGPGYQTRINRSLRAAMLNDMRRKKAG